MIVIADIHSSPNFKPMVKMLEEKYWNDEKFVLAWDIFDRWLNIHEVFQTVLEMAKNDKITITLGNHDLFFILWWWMHKKFK